MTDDIEHITSLAKLPRRRRGAHKGDFGRVLVVGGSDGMIGAVSLAANAALRGGAGLVTFAAPQTVQLAVAQLCPCATSVPLACDASGELASQSVRQFADAAAACDVLAVGPGFAVGPGQGQIVRAALECGKTLVLDADGLNNLALIDNWPALRTAAIVLTPHPGEFARLTGASVADIQADRVAAAAEATRNWLASSQTDQPIVCVLKGADTVVTDGHRCRVNETGNPGMATGGSGDVLIGLTAALAGQGVNPFDAACLGAWVHGRAGDLAAAELGEASVTADDLLERLPAAIIEITSDR